MNLLPKRYHLLAWIGLALVAGFLTISIAAYLASRDAIRLDIARQSLPLTSDNIYSEIQKDLLRPVFISSLMAQDTFLRDWILNGEKDTGQIVHYLEEVRQKYGTISSFLVSARTHRYYYGGGVLKTVHRKDPRDAWFFRVEAMSKPYETNIDFDMANRDKMTIFINYRVMDYHGNFIGATGVGLALDTMSHLIDSYQRRFHRSIYFVDPGGKIVMAGKSMKRAGGSIRELPGIEKISGQILDGSTVPTHLEYGLGDASILVTSRFIPELGWYLVVEQDVADDVRPVQRMLMVNLAISALVTLLVLGITLYAVNRYQLRLERAAKTDALTGLNNRQAFEILIEQALLEFGRTQQPLSMILFDIDLFKQINDRFGHLAGDRVLKDIAGILRSVGRESDAPTRWGGEEFLILLKNCPLERAAAVAEKLRLAIARHRFALAEPDVPVTVSLGVAQYRGGETQNDFFMRADVALYRAKRAGRNRAEVFSDASPA